MARTDLPGGHFTKTTCSLRHSHRAATSAADSPVAAWCMARRGLALHHIHFASPPYTSLRAKLKVQALACELSEYIGDCVLFVVPYTKPQEYIRDYLAAHFPETEFRLIPCL